MANTAQTTELFSNSTAPLAEKMRPSKLEDVQGQEHLIGENKPLSLLLSSGKLPSIIFWGPPGTGKTTIARILASESGNKFHQLSAVLSGVADLRKIIDKAKIDSKAGEQTILFVDEIHRWNKAQQDALLPHVENGLVTIIGSTTENPSFEVIGPLLSRTKVYVINPINEDGLKSIIIKTLNDNEEGLGKKNIKIDDSALDYIIQTADGDARRALNTLEIATELALQKNVISVDCHPDRSEGTDSSPSDRNDNITTLTIQEIESAVQKKSLLYDKSGEEHYNIISAFIKSMRGSDPDAAVYYLARMLEAGEDPLFLARRMVIFASEDIGNADPQAIQVAISCMQSFDFVGMPEGWIPLAQSATYLASAPKSNASYKSYKYAKRDILDHGILPVPKHLRNAPTKLMKNLGYSKGYRYPHDEQGNFAKGAKYLPEKIQNKKYYKPTENGYERIIKERLMKLKSK